MLIVTSGWHMFLLCAGLSIPVAIIVYIYIPEAKGLPMKELGALFGDEVVVHMTTDGLEIMEQSVTV